MRSRFFLFLLGAGVLAVCVSIAYGSSTVPSLPLSGRVPGVATKRSPKGRVSFAGRRYRIVIEPSLQAGQVGWSSFVVYGRGGNLVGSGGSGGYPTRSFPFSGGSGYTVYSPGHAPKGDVVNYFLTGPEVAAIRVGQKVVETRTGPNLPAGDRAAVFFTPASAPPVILPGSGPRKATRIVPLDSQGRRIKLGRATYPGSAATFWQAPTATTPGNNEPPYTGPDHPLPGSCELSQHGLPALTPEFGHVINRIRSARRAQGEVFLSCIDTTYYLHGWPLLVAVLLNAKHPGRDLGAIPGAHPVRRHPGAVNIPAGSFPGSLTARRVGRAWLAVQGGASLGQRLRVLAALRIERLGLPQ